MKHLFPGKLISTIPQPPCHVEGAGVLYEADFRDILSWIPKNSIDLILTDPPYGIEYRGYGQKDGGGTKKSNQNLVANDSLPESLNLLESLFRHSARILTPGGCLCCCAPAGGGHSNLLGQWIRIVGDYLQLRETVVWDKLHPGLGGRYRKCYEMVLVATKNGAVSKWHGDRCTPNIFRHSRVFRRPGDHPTPKPIALMEHFINLHSSPGDIILDPFAGHGTTLAAAKKLRRRYLGVEMVANFCEISVERLGQLTI